MAEGSDSEEFSIKECSIYYSFVFDIDGNINPIDLARKLLKTDLALISTNHYPYKERFADGKDPPSDFELAYRFIEKNKLGELSKLNPHSNSPGVSNVTRILSDYDNWHYVRRLHRRYLEFSLKTGEYSKNGSKPPLIPANIDNNASEEILSFAGQIFAGDRMQYSQTYLMENPFERIFLHPINFSYNGTMHRVNVELSVHRTGMSILTFYIHFQNDMSVDKTISLLKPDQLKVSEFTIAEPIISAVKDIIDDAHWNLGNGNPIEDIYGGSRWLKFKQLNDYDLLKIFELYHQAICANILNVCTEKDLERIFRIKDTSVYPMLFIYRTNPYYDTHPEFLHNHSRPFAGIVAESKNWRQMNRKAINDTLANNHAMADSYSFFLEASHATVLYHRTYGERLDLIGYQGRIPCTEWVLQNQYVRIMAELLNIQKGRLYLYNKQIRSLPHDVKKLTQIKRDLLLAMDEYYDMDLVLMETSSRDIVNNCYDVFGITDLYNDVIFKRDNLEKLIEVKESENQRKLNNSFELVTILVALVLGLSGAQLVIQAIIAWKVKIPIQPDNPLIFLDPYMNFYSGIIDQIVDYVQWYPVQAEIILYVFIVILVVVIIGRNFHILQSLNRKAIISYDQSYQARESKFAYNRKIEADGGTQDKKKWPSRVVDNIYAFSKKNWKILNCRKRKFIKNFK
jgi:hypothetical protein